MANESVDWNLPSPFQPHEDSDDVDEYGRIPKLLAELRMCTLSWALRRKHEWQRKAEDPQIVSKWRQEALDQQKSVQFDEKMTEKMINYVLAELAGYAKIADNERGIERGCFEAIWYSDRIFSNDITERLKVAVSALENVPETEKDWHPGTNGQVLDLVHPSLYCIVYDRTHSYLPGKPRVATTLFPVVAPTFEDETDWSISSKFCWLPSDFSVGMDGSVKLVSSYINNIHPVKHKPLYRVIEEVLTGFIPMFDRVLGDMDNNNPLAEESRRIESAGCIWGDEGPEGQPDYDDFVQDLDEDAEIPAEEEWLNSQMELPEAGTYAGELEQTLSSISLRGRTIQCIIKLANIHLTPEHPKYAGGSWHIEGMANEHIVASGIYYYDEENISESLLSFRVPTTQPYYHGHNDHTCMGCLYGISTSDECVQDIGDMVTKEGRALSWPNVYQHCVSSFHLSDPTKPGHRKILAIFLVDPTIDPIPSTTNVPPQQAEWASEALQESLKDASSLVSRLPQELADLIKGQLASTAMTLKEASAYRLALMEERTVFIKAHSDIAYSVAFNMCEH
ncbi:hypothetical protein DFH06DRAFT_1477909 [Mycena polygramma]|nr:hypothetical protein DFH06DRAFT_1477909 [Mycena polygramma]